ncbi:ADIPOR-like receptor IZH1 [Nakaseomyces bracarensis]|uniref:ADIPOR-like receptor IZH1 n=1 Tax=Nakaseomyces bracarensis TaxID=273131 RepID=A0ABR4NP61_9SACH
MEKKHRDQDQEKTDVFRETVVSVDKLPLWYRRYSNTRIRTGYHYVQGGGYWSCLGKLTHLNNDTVSIYMNGVCTLASLFKLVFYTDMTLVPQNPSTTMTDYIVINLFFMATTMYFGTMTLGQLLKGHSEYQCKLWNQVKQLALVVLVSCSIVTLMYYAFFDHVFLFKMFVIWTVMWMSIACIVIINDQYRRVQKLACVIISGMMSISLPIAVSIVKFGLFDSYKKQRVPFQYLTWEITLYSLSALLQLTRLPELTLSTLGDSFWIVDYLGNSDQLSQFVTVLATVVHFNTIIFAYTIVHKNPPVMFYKE